MKKLLLGALLVLSLQGAYGQTDLTYYHLGAATPQSSVYNPSYFPDAKIYFSLPVLSGFSISANTGFSYGDILKPLQGSDSVKIDLEGLVSKLNPGDRMSLNGSISLFQFGIRKGNQTFSLSSNYRYDVNVLYPVDFLDYFITGNGAYLGEKIEETSLAASVALYKETGLAYTRELFIADGNRLTVGGRVKYLQGLVHIGTEKDASLTMFTDANTYDLSIRFANAVFNTAGLNEIQSDNAVSYLLSPAGNGNSGIGFDLGAQYELNEKIGLSLAINDLGAINWTTDTENYSLTENEVNFIGFSGVDTLNIGNTLSDSLDVWSASEKNSGSFRTSIGPSIFSSATYKVGKNGKAIGTLGLLRSHFGKSQLTYGVGYTHQVKDILIASTTVSGRGKQSINVGLGLSARLGFFQIYTAVDNLSGLLKEATTFQGSAFRFGINFMIGRPVATEVIKKEQKQNDGDMPGWYKEMMDDDGY